MSEFDSDKENAQIALGCILAATALLAAAAYLLA